MNFLTKQRTMNIYPRYVIDPRTGALLSREDFMKREAKGWLGTFETFFREIESAIGEFAHECEDFIPTPDCGSATDSWKVAFQDLEKKKRKRRRR